MDRPNPIADRFIKQLYDWLTPELLYHCFTGEEDEDRLAHIAKLKPWLQEPLLNKAEKEWPERLAQLDTIRKRQKQADKIAVQQFVLNFTDVKNH
jgi:crotonobetainyl-CoA:carnitine CoA-transferase CaiB-like acyl-CoA transferase